MLDTPNLLNIHPRIQIKSMPKTNKVKKKVKKVKVKSISKSKPKIVAKTVATKPKEINKGPIKISKTYIPKDTEKYMCEKHRVFFKISLANLKTK